MYRLSQQCGAYQWLPDELICIVITIHNHPDPYLTASANGGRSCRSWRPTFAWHQLMQPHRYAYLHMIRIPPVPVIDIIHIRQPPIIPPIKPNPTQIHLHPYVRT